MKVNCKTCTTEFNKTQSQINKSKSGNHFCSKSCSAKHNNTYRSRKDRRPVSKCFYCKIDYKTTHKDQQFCSNQCHNSQKWEQKVFLIEDDKSLSHNIIKKYHLIQDPSCSICDISDWQEKQISLELDHIDGDGTNHSKSNTRLLCPNCHSQTENYKSKNTSNVLGRDFRKQRYLKSVT